VNRVTLTGHLGAAPEIKIMPSGDIVANVRLAARELGRARQRQRTPRLGSGTP
jgi:single-stranded DNA-binding protein